MVLNHRGHRGVATHGRAQMSKRIAVIVEPLRQFQGGGCLEQGFRCSFCQTDAGCDRGNAHRAVRQ